MSERGRRLAAVAAIAVLVAAGGGLRVFRLGAKGLWFDEVASVLRAEGRFGVLSGKPEAPGGVGAVLAETREPHPPLYALILRGWMRVAGDGEAALRALSVLASVATIAVAAAGAWSLAGPVAGPRAGVAAALLLAAAPLEVAYAQEARAYALVALLSAVATAALLALSAERGDGAVQPRWRAALWGAYVLAVAGGMAVHYVAVVVPAAHLAAWIALRRLLPGLGRLPLALAGAALLLAPLAPLAAQQVASRSKVAWLRVAPREGGGWTGHAAGLPRALTIQVRPRAPVQAAVASGLVVATLGLAVYGAWRHGARGALVAAVALAGPALLVAVDLATGAYSVRVVRYAIASSPPLWILVAGGLAGLRAAAAGPLGLAIAAASGLASVRHVSLPAKGADYRACTAALAASGCGADDALVLVPSFRGEKIVLEHYLGAAPGAFVTVDVRNLAASGAPLDALAARRALVVADAAYPEAEAWTLARLFARGYVEREVRELARLRLLVLERERGPP